MSNSKPLPSFTFDVLCYLNRSQLEQFSIVCRPLKNIIDRYFHSRPYRVFEHMWIRGGSYALSHNDVQWHPNQEDYSVQQFLAAQPAPYNIGKTYYSFGKMYPYLGPAVRIKSTYIYVDQNATYNPEHIAEMESIAYLWRDAHIDIWSTLYNPFGAVDFRLILNSPTILQCRKLIMYNAQFSFKDYKVLYAVKTIKIYGCSEHEIDLWQQYWPQFLEQPGVKPVVVFIYLHREDIDKFLDRLFKAFSSATSPNAFKVAFCLRVFEEPLTEFRETNKTSSEKLELKKGFPAEYQNERLNEHDECYTLERCSI